MTTRGLGHRGPSSENTYYHAVSQSPLEQDAVALPESPTGSLLTDPEDDESVGGEMVMVVEATPAIRWVHFIFGCAILLPWNGASSREKLYVTVAN